MKRNGVSAMGRYMTLLMSVLTYQAVRMFRSGAPVLPRGWRRLAVASSPGFPRMAYAAESADRIVIAFRGTEDAEDWIKGLTFSQVPYPYVRGAGAVHKGFAELYGTLRQTLLHALKKLPRSKPVYVTGHSMGGALAALCALELAAVSGRRVWLYTFGCPRIGDAVFSKTLARKVQAAYRIYHPGDWVTGLPPSRLLGYSYEHAGRPVPVRWDSALPASGHSMAGYVRSLRLTSGRSSRWLCSQTPALCP